MLGIEKPSTLLGDRQEQGMPDMDTQPDKSFIAELRELLERNPPLNKVDRDSAFQLIKDAPNARTLLQSGPCIGCGAPITYGPPSSVHQSRGDGWLYGVMEKRRNGGSFGNAKLETLEPYLCESCYDGLEAERHRSQEAARQRAIETQQENIERRNAIIRGEIKATPAKRYWSLREIFTEGDAVTLRAMEYRQFLSTIYWDIVRRYALYKAGYACALCHKAGQLHVHHRTYEHRGQEIYHPEDLIVLCSQCHAKFHDKLPQEQVHA